MRVIRIFLQSPTPKLPESPAIAAGNLFLSPAQGVSNHLGTVHAGAQYTLAESASADCLLSTFPELAAQVVPVLRSSQVRFRHPASTSVHASATVETESREKFSRQFERKGRGAIRRLFKIMLSTPRASLSRQCKARFAGNGCVLAKKRNAAVTAQGRPNVNIILNSLLSVEVVLRDEGGTVTLQGSFAWYVVVADGPRPSPE